MQTKLQVGVWGVFPPSPRNFENMALYKWKVFSEILYTIVIIFKTDFDVSITIIY